VRIVVVSVCDIASALGEGVTTRSLARAFSLLGHDVLVSVPAPRGALGADPAFGLLCSYNVTRLGLPNNLNTIPQLFTLVRLALSQRIDLVYLRRSMLTALIGAIMRFLFRKNVICEHNGWSADERKLLDRQVWLAPVEDFLQVLDARCAHFSRVVVPSLRAKLADRGIAPGKIAVIGNATNTDKIFPLDRRGVLLRHSLRADRQYVGFLGSLTVWQGVDMLIRAHALLCERRERVDLIIVGSGFLMDELKTLAGELGTTDRVVFLGEVPYDEVNEVLNCFDVAALPTKASFFLEFGRSPLKLRDYAAAGRPVVATRVAGISDLESEPWLLLHEPDDVADFAAQLDALLASPERLVELGVQARRYAEAHFAWPKIAGSILAAAGSQAACGAEG